MILLNTPISFTSTTDGLWLLINPESNGVYRVNEQTKILCEALQSSDNLREAHGRYQSASRKQLTFENFNTIANTISKRIRYGNNRARKAMTIGFTILPARLFKRIAKPFACFINVWFMALAAVLLLPALLIGLHGSSFTAAVGYYRQGLVGLLIILASVVFHEIGHAASLLKVGRIVGKLGGGVMLIFPAMFTEVLEHTVMSRREKFWLNISGIYFQVIFAHCVLFIGLLFQMRSLMDYALVVYLIAFFQLLPLNGQDGVWLISDLLPRHGKIFHIITQFVSIIIAGIIIVPMVVHVLIPYWKSRFNLFEAGYNLFFGNINLNISYFLASVIAVMWLWRIIGTVSDLIRRRRTAGIVAAKQKRSIT